MTRWLCMADRANAAVAKVRLVWGVPVRYRNTMAKVHIGDTFLIYARQDHAGGEVKPSAVMGAYEVVSAPFEDATPIFAAPPFLPGEVFPIRVKLRPLPEITAPVEFKPLVPELSFIKNKVMWSGSIRGAMRMIPEQDYQRIVRGGV
jgi:predicted RNA-binding protein